MSCWSRPSFGAVHRRAREPGDARALPSLSGRAAALARATTSELEPQIQSTGFFRAKSKALDGHGAGGRRAARRRDSGNDGGAHRAARRGPQDGQRRARPCARCPGLPVDRHVLRVANRIGIARSDDPVVVEQQLGAALPPADWTRASDTLILHGRRICKPQPLCDRCAVRDACEYYRRVVVPSLRLTRRSPSVRRPSARETEARSPGRRKK